jgi:hypothetical protein
MWWDSSDLRVARKTTKVKTCITPSILAQMGQVRSLSASTQRVDVDGLVLFFSFFLGGGHKIGGQTMKLCSFEVVGGLRPSR